MKDEASFVCASCGEEIVLFIDLSAGSVQECRGSPGLLPPERRPHRG